MDPSTNPINPKVTAGAAGVAVATLVVFISAKAGVDYTAEEAIGVTGALGTLASFVLGRFTPGAV